MTNSTLASDAGIAQDSLICLTRERLNNNELFAKFHLLLAALNGLSRALEKK
jgi:hypothetical protein